MAPAWLDSLSEDWPSQAGSEPSHSPTPSMRNSKSSRAAPASRSNSSSGGSGGGGKLFGSVRHAPDASSGSNVLGERSVNEFSVSGVRYSAAKLSSEHNKAEETEAAQGTDKHAARRAISASSYGSVVHNTVEHRLPSTSAGKGKAGDTPEWRRRIVEGQLAYGEQLDLFTSARTGLENMFNPPAGIEEQETIKEEEEEEVKEEVEEEEEEKGAAHGQEASVEAAFRGALDMISDMTISSSPPVRMAKYDSSDLQYDESAQQLPQRPRANFLETLPEEDTVEHRENDEASASLSQEEQGSVRRHNNAQAPQSADSSSCYDDSQIRRAMDRESRAVSGQSVLRNESFSAILISPEKDKGSDGAVFGPVELPSGELKQRLGNLRWSQMVQSEEGTDDYETMGGFSNFHSHGRPADGSYRDRLLSTPIIGNDTSEMLPEESLQASTPKRIPSIRVQAGSQAGSQPVSQAGSQRAPQVPRVAKPAPEKRGSLLRQPPSTGGSPLKLFGPYDTFTNQTLMRRISQYEDDMSNDSQVSTDHPTRPAETETEAEVEAEAETSELETPAVPPPSTRGRQSSSHFGAGDLDEYEFSDEQISHLSRDDQHQPGEGEEEGGESRFPEPQSLLSRSEALFPSLRSNRKPSGLSVQRMRQSRNAASSRPGTAEKWAEAGDLAASTGKIPHLATPRRAAAIGVESKRPRTSPSKDPTPKRRRTLHKSDVAFGIEGLQSSPANLDSVQMSHNNMQSVLAGRQNTPRPCTPTASRRQSAAASDRAADQAADRASDKSYSSVSEDGSVAAPTGPASGPAVDGTRKPSIRTEDFINEAQKILAMIRGRETGGQPVGLESVEESEMESMLTAERSAVEDEDVSFDSTREPFSRPPSREGKAAVPRMARVQEDPELVARLKKYEERSDLDDIMTTTTRSITVAQDAIRAEREAAAAVQETLGSLGTLRSQRTRLDVSDEISDPPNIRITMNPRHQQQQEQQQQQQQQMGVEHASQRSMSSGQSTARSIPTSSSRGSDTRMTIAPQTVSHLIPDQVGNMILDRDRNIWIKRRTGSSAAGSATTTTAAAASATAADMQPMHNILPSEGSEPDPFADIPDLSVDATLEFRRLKAAAVPSPAKASGPVLFTPPGAGLAVPGARLAVPSATVEDASMSMAAEATVVADDDEEEDEEENDDDDNAPVEHEISINEGRVAHGSSPTRKRHLAISFSSPIASIIRDGSPTEAPPPPPPAVAVAGAASSGSLRRGRRTVSVQFRSTSGNGTQTFVPRPVSRIDEHDEDDSKNQTRESVRVASQELSVLGGNNENDDVSNLVTPRQASLSVLLTTPGPATRLDDEEMLAQCVGMLSLSPMSEFTIHHERSLALETSYVVGDRHVVTGDGSKAVMTQSLRELVSRLAEVQPFEPYWEDMEELDMQGKQLASLHKLDAFCPQLVSLDAGGNALRNVSGVPATVRHLRVADNALSELTPWTHLANLQYVDVSNNALRTLSGLAGLVHLRSVRADHCALESLQGLLQHDGLQTLRARGNRLGAVDFGGTRLRQLVELDLEGSGVASVAHVEELGALTTLNLRRNQLEGLGEKGLLTLPRLRTLNVSDNRLTGLDVHGLPALRVLFADRNRLARVRGFSKTPRLDTVSLREQALLGGDTPARLDISSLYHAYEIRKLYLSGNVLDSFDPPVDFLNLQLLELANCGLTRLPARLGRAVPNLRKVNLNYNALADLGALRGIARLKRVLAAGNRLAHAYAAIQTLSSFAHLAEVDLRDNPVTQGFYPRFGVGGSPGVSSGVSPGSGPGSGPGSEPGPEKIGQEGTEVSRKSKDGKDKKDESAPPEPFTLPPADPAQDRAYCSRLDLATGMRRRVYSQVFGDACSRLEVLDGLAVDRTLGAVRDGVWEALRAKGIVAGGDEKGEEDSRWGAEDTFA